MVYVLFLKDDIAVAKSCRKTLDNIDIGIYDGYVKVTKKEYCAIELPSKKVDDEWVKTSVFPSISWQKAEMTEKPISAVEQLRADVDYIAIMTEVEL